MSKTSTIGEGAMQKQLFNVGKNGRQKKAKGTTLKYTIEICKKFAGDRCRGYGCSHPKPENDSFCPACRTEITQMENQITADFVPSRVGIVHQP